MRTSRIRIRGNDRALMMLARDVRRRWLQYGESRKVALENSTFDDSPLKGMHHTCAKCNEILKKDQVEIDHINAVGSRPRTPEEFGAYISRMFTTECQVLCKGCHARKTKESRKRTRKTI